MRLSTVPRVLVPALVLLVALAGPAAAASWTTVLKVSGARSQACKVPIQDGKAWRVKVRLVNRGNERVNASYSVYQGAKVVDRASLAARPGQATKVRSVVIRRGGSQTLGAGMSTADGGLGDSNVLAGIGRC